MAGSSPTSPSMTNERSRALTRRARASQEPALHDIGGPLLVVLAANGHSPAGARREHAEAYLDGGAGNRILPIAIRRLASAAACGVRQSRVPANYCPTPFWPKAITGAGPWFC